MNIIGLYGAAPYFQLEIKNFSGKKATLHRNCCEKKSFALFLNVAVHFCQEQIYSFMGTALYFQLEIKRENDRKNVRAIIMFYANGSLPARDKKGN